MTTRDQFYYDQISKLIYEERYKIAPGDLIKPFKPFKPYKGYYLVPNHYVLMSLKLLPDTHCLNMTDWMMTILWPNARVLKYQIYFTINRNTPRFIYGVGNDIERIMK